MDDRTLVRHSKFLSFVLRHRPDSIGISLDAQGWVAIACGASRLRRLRSVAGGIGNPPRVPISIDELLAKCREHGRPLTRAMLDEVVEKNSKRRLAVSEDGTRIRASQGHSVDVDLGYAPATPPELLFHGTAARNLDAIRAQGLQRMNRHHVHLSPDAATASAVGARHGRPVVLRVLAGKMAEAGHTFYLSANGVWLTDEVPPAFIQLEERP